MLWESPSDTPYAASSHRARVGEQQSSAAQLVAIIIAATNLPLLDIAETVNVVAKSGSVGSAASAGTAAIPSSLTSAGTRRGDFTILLKGESRPEKWRRMLISLLGLIAIVAVMIWLSGGVGH